MAVALALVVALLGDGRESGPLDPHALCCLSPPTEGGGVSRTTATKASSQVPRVAALPDTVGLSEQSRQRRGRQGGLTVGCPPQEGTQEGTAPEPWPSQCQSSEPDASHLTILPTYPPALTPRRSPTVPASGGPGSSQRPKGASLGPLSALGRGPSLAGTYLKPREQVAGCALGPRTPWPLHRAEQFLDLYTCRSWQKPSQQTWRAVGSPEMASLDPCLKHPVSTVSQSRPPACIWALGGQATAPTLSMAPPAGHLLANLGCGEGPCPASCLRPPGPEDPPAHP